MFNLFVLFATVELIWFCKILATPVQLRQRQAGMIARSGLSNTPVPLRLDNSPNLSMSLPREIVPSMVLSFFYYSTFLYKNLPFLLPNAFFQNRNLARPLLPAHRGPFERLVDYLIGDGPENRFALICVNCKGHNGKDCYLSFFFLFIFMCLFFL